MPTPEFHGIERAAATLFLALPSAILSLLYAPPARADEDIIGQPMSYVTRYEDTLLDVARDNDLGYVEIRAANPAIDPWLPGAGQVLTLPTVHIFPAAPRRGIVINLPELRLYFFEQDGTPHSFPIGIGEVGKETPLGQSQIIRKARDPPWFPTRSERRDDPDLPVMVAPGPDNPMGDFALYLARTRYAIHGTNNVYSIGRRGTHGCIRLYPEDIEILYRLAPISTPVTVVNQQTKLGWSGGELYLEIHPSPSEIDAIEEHGIAPLDQAIDAGELVRVAAGDEAWRLDWRAVHLAEAQRNGIVTRITVPSRR